MERITEQPSLYRHLEKMDIPELLKNINHEDKKVAPAVEKLIPKISRLVSVIASQLEGGGRLFYIGAGTSGRLGILDASECPPTFGVSPDMVVGLIAGGDRAIRTAVEFAEDSQTQAWTDLQLYEIDKRDAVVGIAASGTTPYVVHGLKTCQLHGIPTGCITCNPGSPVVEFSDHPIEVVVGPEFITGSTRMKGGTAQKLILNMISTATMIRLERVLDNKMVDMQLTNNKLVHRGTEIIIHRYGLTNEESRKLLMQHGSVRRVFEAMDPQKGSDEYQSG